MFEFCKINNKKFLKSDVLTNVEHLFTTRDSVVTAKDCKSLHSLCISNLKIVAEYLNILPSSVISPIQTHSANIAVAKLGEHYPNTDALVVEDTNIAILLNYADCTPVIIYDSYNDVGSVIHAGWRGTAASIVPKTVEFMKMRYNSQPSDLTAVIGPAISLNNYQVDSNVYNALKNTLNKEYTDYYVYNTIDQKYNVDLKTINYHQLEELGVKRIDKCEYCTYDSVDVFFSYRRENGLTARHSAILKLVNKGS